MLISALALISAKHAEAQSDSVETLAQHALEKYTQKWFQYPAHKIKVHGSKSLEWDEYKLKSPDGKNIVLRKYSRGGYNSRENLYQIYQSDARGGVLKPSDGPLRKILRENHIADLEDYVGILENVTQYKKNNIKVSLHVNTSAEVIHLTLTQNDKDAGRLFISGEMRPKNLTGALKYIASNKIAYLVLLSIYEGHQGLGLSYPLMCVGFRAAKGVYGDEYVVLQDLATERPGIYEKMGFKLLEGAAMNMKWATISDLLNSEKCEFMNR
jgi:hypothetical protein